MKLCFKKLRKGLEKIWEQAYNNYKPLWREFPPQSTLKTQGGKSKMSKKLLAALLAVCMVASLL
ncbi:MAG: hypothetical protein K2P01_05005, partial [Oscillospiraceae bacterium]|nr:hypothetical protein [Oscillospiraceae bacterium]